MASVVLDAELVRAMRRAARAEVERQLAEEARVADVLRARLIERLSPVLTILRESGRLSAARIFGSYAWGTPTEGSDLDLLIDSDTDALEIATVISTHVGLDVHAIDRRRAPASLVARVDAEGVEV